jgi:hypothetical protein
MHVKTDKIYLWKHGIRRCLETYDWWLFNTTVPNVKHIEARFWEYLNGD